MADLLIRIKSIFDGKGFKQGEAASGKLRNDLKSLASEVGLGLGLAVVTKEIADFGVGAVRAAEHGRVVESAFTNLSGSVDQARRNLEAMNRATRNQVDTATQMQIANQLLGMNIVSTADQMEEVVNVSRRLGKEFRGLGTEEAAQEFAIMISNMSVQRLDSFGIASGAVRKRIDELMDSTAGMTREEAFFQAAMEEARKTMDRLGPEIKTIDDRTAELGARWADFQGEIGEIFTSQDVDLFDRAIVGATIFVEELTAGAQAWQGIVQNAGALASMVSEFAGGAEGLFGGMGEGLKIALENAIPGSGLIIDRMSDLTKKTNERIAEEQVAAQAEGGQQQAAVETETADELLDIKRDLAADLLDEQRQTNADLADLAKDRGDAIEDAEEEHADRVGDIRKRAAKDRLDIEKDFKKDLEKLNQDLGKSLAKQQQDEAKQIERVQKDAGRDEVAQQKRKKIDTLADERLFQFELRQLAAEGDGIAIRDALERRAIEEEIAKEKADVEKEIERDKKQDQIAAIREEGQERREQLQLDNQERQQLLQERNQEEIEELNLKLAEDLRAEAESYVERRGELTEYYDERQAAIREGEQEGIAEIATGLATARELTKAELSQLAQVALGFGEQTGGQFARGLTSGFLQNAQVDAAVSGGGSNPLAGLGNISGPVGRVLDASQFSQLQTAVNQGRSALAQAIIDEITEAMQ